MIKIYIDPGHGGKDPGAVGNGIQEKDIALTLGKKIRDILAAEYDDLAIKMSRTGDTFPTLSDRTNDANSWGANYFLSIHCNAGGGDGFESYIYPKSDSKTKEAQKNIHSEIMKEITGTDDRGMKEKDLHVLRESNMSALLTENLFIDTSGDAAKLKDASFLDKLARGHVDGLEKALNLKRKTSGAQSPGGALFKVQVGAFSDRKNAESLAAELKTKGYPTIIVES
jgi:N-acetylmuramoyl-L-alanine amidase